MQKLLDPIRRRFTADSTVVEQGTTCLNCEASLTGAYCAQCGQKVQPANPRLGDIASDAWENFVNVDGKFVRSIRDLLRHPGLLTREYLAGRRARYVPPFRLYLICSVAYFLMSAAEDRRNDDGDRASYVNYSADDSVATPRSGPAAGGVDSAVSGTALDAWWRERKARVVERLKNGEQDLNQIIASKLPKVMFFLVPAFALLLRVVYRSRRWNLPAHLVVALHIHAFFFAILLAAKFVKFWTGQALSPWADFALITWMMGYGLAMLRGIYGGRWWTTALRAGVLSASYFTLGILGMIALIVIVVVTL
jgi:hypothetical protein